MVSLTLVHILSLHKFKMYFDKIHNWQRKMYPWSTETSNKPQQSKLVKCDWNPTITDGIVSNNTTDTECSQMIVPIVKEVGLQGVLFLGDSTMDRLWKEVHELQQINPVSSKKIISTRCDWLHWSRTREVPFLLGLEHHWCTFCKYCNTFMVMSKNKENILFPMECLAASSLILLTRKQE